MSPATTHHEITTSAIAAESFAPHHRAAAEALLDVVRLSGDAGERASASAALRQLDELPAPTIPRLLDDSTPQGRMRATIGRAHSVALTLNALACDAIQLGSPTLEELIRRACGEALAIIVSNRKALDALQRRAA